MTDQIDVLKLTASEQTSAMSEAHDNTLSGGESPQIKPPGLLLQALESVKQYATFAHLLRMGGAAVIVTAMSLFLLQGIEVTNDLQRYFTLLGHTGILTAAGFLVSYLLRDNKGARVFFGLSLISVPVNFAVLGAMIYSLIPLDLQSIVYPKMVHWQAQSMGSVALAAVTGAAVLVPVTYFGFAIMARPFMRLLGSLSLVACLTLLIPVRETAWVMLIALALILTSISILSRYASNNVKLKTMEGRFARALVFIPALLLVGRSIALYSADIYALLVVCVSAYFLVWHGVKRLSSTGLAVKLAYVVAIPLVWLIAAIGSYLATSFNSTASVPVFALIFGCLIIELARHCTHNRTNKVLHFFSAAVLLATAYVYESIGIFGTSIFYGIETSAAVAVAVLLYATFRRHFVTSFLAMVFLLPHVTAHILQLWNSIDFTNWMTLAVLGIFAILSASLIERYGAVYLASRKRRKNARLQSTRLDSSSESHAVAV